MSNPPTSFPRSYWEADKIANLALIEFFAAPDWKGIKLDSPPSDPTTINKELDMLRAYRDTGERDKRRAEIVAQSTSVDGHYFARLMMSEKSHPRTFELMQIAVVVGRALVMHFKREFGRVRPAQLAPDLEPMIPTPGHPSYPAGHPFQAKLMSLLLSEVRPDARQSLLALADRIGENREVAGVHYRSDTAAGMKLADLTFVELGKSTTVQAVLAAARAEWA